MVDKAQQYLTYQHNVQKYFKKHQRKYDGVILPFSIVVSYPSGTYGFIRALCTSDHTKTYAIDPRTPLFQKSWDRAQAREPHKKVAEVLGPPFFPVGLDRALLPSDFANVMQEVTRKCIEFQLQFRARKEDARKLKKYSKLLGVDYLQDLAKPQFLIPPYFEFINAEDPWFSISMRAIDYASHINDDVEIRPVIHFRDWSGINPNIILGALAELRIRSCFLYPNNFREHDATGEELRSYRHCTELTIQKGISAYALFGGYYAILLSFFGLKGFANGIGYGEWRDSNYHKGGSPAIRLYIPKLHRYLDPPVAQTLLDSNPDYFSAGSSLLTACVQRGRPLVDVSPEEALEHFMESRLSECMFVANHSLGEALAELEQTVSVLNKVGPIEREKYSRSLLAWVTALSE